MRVLILGFPIGSWFWKIWLGIGVGFLLIEFIYPLGNSGISCSHTHGHSPMCG